MAGVVLALVSGLLFAGYMINLQRTKGIDPVYLTWVNNLCLRVVALLVCSSPARVDGESGDDSRRHGGGAARRSLLSLFQGIADGVVAGGIADRLDRAGAQSAVGSANRWRVAVDGDDLGRRVDPVRPRCALCLAVGWCRTPRPKVTIQGIDSAGLFGDAHVARMANLIHFLFR